MGKMLLKKPQLVDEIPRIDVDHYHKMIETGILPDGAPVELIDGLLVLKDRSSPGEDPMSIGKPHNIAVSKLSRLNSRLDQFGCYLQIQGPITLRPYQEPEPDGAIIRGDPDAYDENHPEPEDVCCVFEAAAKSLSYDRTTKLAKYADAGIPQYVIINLIDKKIELYEGPVKDEGKYKEKKVLIAGQTLSLYVGRKKRLEIPVESILPK